jgi:hypothetical protein
MNFSDISLLRLYNQKIIQSSFKIPAEVLSWLGAIQGQDYMGAKWSVGIRLPKATDLNIENAFIHKKILRTWLMRGTLHIVSAKDIEWMRKLVNQKIITGNARRYKELELDTSTFVKSNDLLVKFLQDKQPLDRKELLALLEKHGISTKGQRAAYILQRASYEGLICQTNTIRNSPNYVLSDNAIADTKAMTRDESIVELTKRYFTSRGPATLYDFVWWSGLTVTEAKVGLEANKAVLHQEVIGGQVYWLSSDNQPLAKIKAIVHLLPGFDEFLLGYKDRSASLDSTHNNYWCPGGNGMFFPFLVVDGQVIGTWKREFKKTFVSIEVKSFDSRKELQDNQDIVAAAGKFSKFVGMELAM